MSDQNLKQEIEQLQRKKDELRLEYYAKKSQFEKYQQSVFYRLFQKAPIVKRHIRLGAKYLTRKRSVREFFNPEINERKANKRIKRLRYQMYELGFTYEALEQLKYMYRTSDIKALRMQAAFELGRYYADQYTVESAKEGIQYLNDCIKKDRNKKRKERATIMLAECLVQLGQKQEAKNVIERTLASSIRIDSILALASIEESFENKIKKINEALKLHQLAELEVKPLKVHYNHLLNVTPNLTKIQAKEKVTVIVPAYNAENTIHIAIESLIKQTWGNLEIIIVDDCSQDDTYKVAKQYEKQYPIIKVLQTPKNSGPYVARNIALNEATGDYITINDADDWSHPEKIEKQVTYLIENKQVVANTSEQARLTEDLTFFRRGKPGYYVFANMSSLMFKKEVLQKLGYWDSVRFGADGEFKKRLALIYGKEAVVDLKTGPLSFQRQSKDSLTGNSAFGYPGYFMGARKEYFESYTRYHQQHENQLYYSYPMEKRPYPVPEPMWPERVVKSDERHHFDVIIASDFRLLGGTNMSNIEEIKAQKEKGLKTGLIQLSRFDVTSTKMLNPKVRDQIDGSKVQMIVYGEKVSCDVLIVRHPPILEHWQKYVPDVKAKQVKVIINQTPKHEYSKEGKTLYHLKNSAKRIKEYFGKKGIWHPIGPLVRESLLTYHKEDLKNINLSSEDWINIINVSEWKRHNRPNNDKIVIGRHSRDHYVKWPNDVDELLTVYPNVEPFEVRILGGAKTPLKMLGTKPENWTIYEFGEIHPKQFLKEIDIFLYYTHPDLLEAFGRVMFEAMAAGVPVVLPPIYKPVFKEAAIYAEWQDVQYVVKELMNNPEKYEQQVQSAWQYVEKNFGYQKHLERIEGAFTETLKHEA